jgi:hypothetical protein
MPSRGPFRHLTYRADGHGALTDPNACVSLAAIQYLEAGILPPEGASCRQEVPEPDVRLPARRLSGQPAFAAVAGFTKVPGR